MAEEEKGYTTIDQLDPAEALNGSEAIHGTQNNVDVKITPSQIRGFLGVSVAIAEGTCDTAAGTANKVVDIPGYNLATKDILAIKFTNANTYGDTTAANPTFPNLVVNGTVLKVCDSRGHAAGSGCWAAGDRIEFRVNLDAAEVYIMTHDVRQINANGVTITADGSAYYNKQSVDSLIKTKQFKITLSNYTFTKSAQGLYYTVIPFSDFTVEGKVISVDIADFIGIRATDIIQPGIKSNTELYVLSNTNSFATTSSGIYVLATYI